MRRLILGACLAVMAASCDDDSPSGPPTSAEPEANTAETQAFLVSFDRDLVAPTYAAMRTSAGALVQATTAWAAAPADAEARSAAQTAWQAAMDVWQQAEMLQIGPASRNLAGADRLRDEVYSWPQHNPCRIDQEIGRDMFEGPDFASARLVNTYGLDALEYALFAPSGNECPPQVSPNSDGVWAGLGEAGITAGRARYAKALAEQIERDVTRLADAWTPFAADLVQAGVGSTHYESRQAALNDVFAALFYLELGAKDAKIGDVAGITAGCMNAACPENVESRWAGRDAANLLANLRAADAILFGAGPDGVGFTHLLDARGAQDLTASLRTALDAAIASISALDAPFAELATTQPERLRAAYDAIKAVTDLLKTQFVTTLNLSVPDEGASDND